MIETKLAIVVSEELQTWQKLNVTAFLMSGIVGANPGIIGRPYIDRGGRTNLPLSVQPVIVLSAASRLLTSIRIRAYERGVSSAVYVNAMFMTGDDDSNRAAFSKHDIGDDVTVGIALRAEKRIVDKITKGARMHE